MLDKSYAIDIQEGAAYNLYAICQVCARVDKIRNTGLFIIPLQVVHLNVGKDCNMEATNG